MNNIKRIIVFLFIFFISSNNLAESTGYKVSTGFVNNHYGISFYYDKDNYYNDGWHLIDDNGDGLYEYYYFSLSGHMLKDTIAPNGYQLNQDGKLIINNTLYQVNFIDVVNSNVAIFLNKKESVYELTKGFETDYNQVFTKWYTESSVDIINQLNSIANNLTVQKVNKVRDEISRRVKECKKIGTWYSDRLYSAKKAEFINKDEYRVLGRNLQKDMSSYINRFREEMGNVIESMGY